MAKAIMIQGTMSGVGKSLLTAGLCRIFKQDGYRVAPFKSQNMALNSYITSEGLEMGRAQVMQAEAAGMEPSVDMNPILLKPTGDVGSQVIVNGEVLGNYSARDYFAFKKQLVPQIIQAYRRLEERSDIIVIEGAGSPAEINLKTDDIVNMGMAKMADAPVLLVGDIDRGGVFAQLLGTVDLLDKEERARVKGLVINKFRGDKTILDPGITMLEERAGIPVVGTIPYMHIQVDEEDSLTGRLETSGLGNQSDGISPTVVDIAVIRLPRISNFTDFHPLERLEGVQMRYVERVSQLGDPDMIILPGTKNTMDDLKWLREGGLEAAIKKAAARGKIIMGICSGFQMLGEWLEDPQGVESGTAQNERISMTGFRGMQDGNGMQGGGSKQGRNAMRGLELLPVRTVFTQEKTRTQVSGHIAPLPGLLSPLSGVRFEGYEIHMGITTPTKNAAAFATLTSVSGDGAWSKQDGTVQNNVLGTYVHGIFDEGELAAALLRLILRSKGLSERDIGRMDTRAFKESQYDLLADTLRSHLDMAAVYEMMKPFMV